MKFWVDHSLKRIRVNKALYIARINPAFRRNIGKVPADAVPKVIALAIGHTTLPFHDSKQVNQIPGRHRWQRVMNLKDLLEVLAIQCDVWHGGPASWRSFDEL